MTADELKLVEKLREQSHEWWGSNRPKPSPVVKAGVDHWGSLLNLAIYLGVTALIVFACSVR